MNNKFSIFLANNGLQLTIKSVPVLLIQKVMGRLKSPSPPVIFNEDKGRNEENPSHPSYIAALEAHDLEKASVTMDAFIRLGVVRVNDVPEGYESVDDNGWFNNVLALLPDTDPNVEKQERTLLWLKYYMLDDSEDLQELVAAISGLSGVRNEDVNAAMDTFPDHEER